MPSNFNYPQHNYIPTESIEVEDGLPFVIPDGLYMGKWGGYIVDLELEGRKYKIKTKWGVRGINVPVRVVIDCGEIWIK